MKQLRQDLETTYREYQLQLVRELKHRFPSLDLTDCEDAVQLAFMQALQELDKPKFKLDRTWLAWLRTVARYRSIDMLRRREAQSLEALMRSVPGDGGGPVWEPADPDLTPSGQRRLEQQTERRRVLVSDILAAYVAHVEQYGMYVQREVLERRLRGQLKAGDIAKDMGIPPETVSTHRYRALNWIAEQVAQRDSRGSILNSVFGGQPVAGGWQPIPSHRLYEFLRLPIDEVGALCPSDERLEQYRQNPDAAEVSDIRYHVTQAVWYAEENQRSPGCRLCQSRLQ